MTTVANGSSLALRASIASGFSRRAPLFAIITGSTTSELSLRAEISAATTSMISALASIPVFTASQPMSLAHTSICRATNFGSISTIAYTPVVFCAVRAVIAVMPKASSAETVFRSA